MVLRRLRASKSVVSRLWLPPVQTFVIVFNRFSVSQPRVAVSRVIAPALEVVVCSNGVQDFLRKSELMIGAQAPG